MHPWHSTLHGGLCRKVSLPLCVSVCVFVCLYVWFPSCLVSSFLLIYWTDCLLMYWTDYLSSNSTMTGQVWLDARTKAKVHILRRGSEEVLQTLIDLDQIPSDYGGTAPALPDPPTDE